MEISKRNLNISVVLLIVSFFTLALYPTTIFIGSEMLKNGIDSNGIFFISGFLAIMIFASGVLFLISLILNIKESRKLEHMSKGLKFTWISTAPVVLCYTGILIKALTEGH